MSDHVFKKEVDGSKENISTAVSMAKSTESKNQLILLSTTSNVSKMLILSVGVLILISAIVAIVIATGSSDKFESSQEQFNGDIQFDDSEEEIIEWNEEFNDVNSPKARALIERVKPAIAAALEAEGFNIDNLEIESMTPGEETTVEHAEKITESELEYNDQKNILEKLEKYGSLFEERSFLRSTGQSFYKTKTYKNIKPVVVKFKSFGTPAKNAAIVGSSNLNSTILNKLSPALSVRLGSVGLRARVKALKPQSGFISSVQKVVSKNPLLIKTTIPPQQTVQEIKDCSSIGSVMFKAQQTSQSLFKCAQTCKDSALSLSKVIYGGFEDTYNDLTRACTAAYASFLINDRAKGVFEILSAGVRPAKNRTEQIQGDWITLAEEPITSKLYKLKKVGGVITPTVPPTTQPPSNQNFRFSTTTANSWIKTEPQTNKVVENTVGGPYTLMVIYVRCYAPKGNVENPIAFYSDPSTRKGKEYVLDIIKPTLHKIESYGFKKVVNEGLFLSYHKEWFALMITVNGESNFVEVITKMNRMEHKSFQMQIEQDLKLKKVKLGSVRLTKKGRELLMT